jgi:hypothetical protein
MSENAELINMREKWSGAWRIWRARRTGDVADERSGDYVASRMDPNAGADRTVMDPSLTALDVLLQVQAQAVQTGRQPYEIHSKWANQ